MTHGSQPLPPVQPVEITNLCKLATNSEVDCNYKDSTPIFRLKTQRVLSSRIYGVTDGTTAEGVPGNSTILHESSLDFILNVPLFHGHFLLRADDPTERTKG